MPELIWEGKDAVINYHHSLAVRELKIDQHESLSPEPSLDDNLIIEGDNIEVLKSLIPKFASKIDVIYIDPPYNTGNENWVYNDNLNSPQIKSWLGNVVGKEDLQRHDKWLCMMYPRLVLARELLSESGVIFISIDDNEIHNLKLLMDEIFGEENLEVTLHVEMSTTQGMKVAFAQKGKVVKNAEYTLIYKKSSLFNDLETSPLYYPKEWDNHYSLFISAENKSSLLKHLKTNSDFAEFKINNSKDISSLYSLNNLFRDKIHKISDKIYQDAEIDTSLSLNDDELNSLNQGFMIKHKKYLLKKTSTGKIRQLLSLESAIGQCDDLSQSYGLRKIIGDWWSDYYKDMMNIDKEGFIKFQNGKKPLRLIRNLIKKFTNVNSKNALILDFFAGSGTTGHAVLEMNKEDGGSRKFILIQQPEESEEVSKQNFKNIFEITTTRIRRCIKGVETAKDPKLKEGLGGSFTVVKLGEALHLNTLFLEKNLPSYEALASYLFYHTTNQALSNVTENASHYIGKTENYKLYLIYSADKEKLKHHDYALSRSKLEQILKDCGNDYQALIYAVTIYVDNKSIKSLMEKEKYTKKPIICQIPYQYLQINSANVLNNLEDSED